MQLQDAEELKKCVITLQGWNIPLEITYGLIKASKQTYLIWQVKSTTHVFKIPLKIITTYHGGDYEMHFKQTLMKFREDLILWYNGNLPEYDMGKYLNEFGPWIC
jgi:hypothetical protein